MKHRPFVKFVLKKRWVKINRVFIGKDKSKYSREITEWCEDQEGQWYRSDGWETYFFENEYTAFAFKMRWAGTLHNPFAPEEN